MEPTALLLAIPRFGALAWSQTHGTLRWVRLWSHLDARLHKHPHPHNKFNHSPWNWKPFLPFPSIMYWILFPCDLSSSWLFTPRASGKPPSTTRLFDCPHCPYPLSTCTRNTRETYMGLDTSSHESILQPFHFLLSKWVIVSLTISQDLFHLVSLYSLWHVLDVRRLPGAGRRVLYWLGGECAGGAARVGN